MGFNIYTLIMSKNNGPCRFFTYILDQNGSMTGFKQHNFHEKDILVPCILISLGYISVDSIVSYDV